MKRTYKKPSQSLTSTKPTTLNLQTRGFTPPQKDLDEEIPKLTKISPSENILARLLSIPRPEASEPIQRKPQDHLQAIRARRMPIQAKLNIGEPNDKYEQEADATASRVVQQINSSTQDQSVQRQESMEEEEELQMKPISKIQRQESMEEEDEELQMKSVLQRRENVEGGEASTDLESSIQSARRSGQSLDANLQAKMGQAMGADFSGVKVHTDSQSDQLNKSIQAKAFTTGQDVFFRQGEYNPSSQSGQELIAHELTHVMQQSTGSAIRKKRQENGAKETTVTPSQLGKPSVQRFNIEANAPIPWQNATEARFSGKGAKGVLFVKDNTESPVVVKASSDDVGETFLASALHEEVSGAKTPTTKVGNENDRNCILDLMEQKVDWETLTPPRNIRDDRPQEVRVQETKSMKMRNYRQERIFIMGMASGKDFESLITDNREFIADLIQKPNYMKRMGMIFAVDMFLGNGDRLYPTINLGNWMINETTSNISLIDNFDDNSGDTFNSPYAAEENFRQIAPSNQSNIASQVIKKLEDTLHEKGMLTKDGNLHNPYRNMMTKSFEQGIAQGRAKIIAKLTTFINDSKLKSSTRKGGDKKLWNKVKERARLLRSLT